MIFSKIINPFKWFFSLFKPQNFNNNPYYWLLNQFGHIGLGLVFSWLIDPLAVVIFFVLWETTQYFTSKDIKDGIEDLTFIIVGVLMFLFFCKWVVLLGLIILVIRLFQKYYK